jgi:hypothetical protein
METTLQSVIDFYIQNEQSAVEKLKKKYKGFLFIRQFTHFGYAFMILTKNKTINVTAQEMMDIIK